MNIFVIMKFDEEMNEVYLNHIKSPLEAAGYHVSRSDDPAMGSIRHQNLYHQIMQGIWDADYIVADLTVFNGNVYYELGIAHTLRKRTIQVSQHLRIPSDIDSQWVYTYSVDPQGMSELDETLLEILQQAEQGKYIFSSMVDDFLLRTSRTITTTPPA